MTMNYKKMVGLLEDIRKSLQAEAGQEHPGERCAKGTHWNDQENKCKPLPAGLLKKSRMATKFSKATWGPHAAGRSPSDQIQAHSIAAKAHRQASDAAYSHGFNTLGNHHRRKEDYHTDMLT